MVVGNDQSVVDDVNSYGIGKCDTDSGTTERYGLGICGAKICVVESCSRTVNIHFGCLTVFAAPTMMKEETRRTHVSTRSSCLSLIMCPLRADLHDTDLVHL